MNEGFWPFEKLQVEDAYEGEHSSYRSNPLIALGFFKAGEIETWGQGYEKIKDVCELAGAPLPEIKATQGSVTMVVRGSEHYMELLKNNLGTQVTTHAGTQATTHVSTQDSNISVDAGRMKVLLDYCKVPGSREEMQEVCGIKTREYFRKHILVLLIESVKIGLTIPDKPKSPKQKYFSKE